MNQLSDRLKMLADEAVRGFDEGYLPKVADIGTDHGYLPIYLHDSGLVSKVILTDVSPGSLSKAQDNCRAYLETAGDDSPDSFDLRLGNGLEVLEPGEIDVVVIAGMGGELMTEIMGLDISKTRSFKRFVLQPRSGMGILRRWLSENSFIITRDLLVREGKFICEVIVCELAGTHCGEIAVETIPQGEVIYEEDVTEVPDIFFEVPSWIRNQNDREIVSDYLERRLATQKSILLGLEKAAEADEERLAETRENIEYLEILRGLL